MKSGEDRWDMRQAIEDMDSDARHDDETRRDGEPMTWGGYDTGDDCKRCVAVVFYILYKIAFS